MPLAGERLRLGHAGVPRQLLEERADVDQLLPAGLVDGVLAVVDLEQRVDEQAPLEVATPEPPVDVTVRTTWNPSAGLPMAIDFAMVDGLTGSGNSSPSSSARTTGAQPAACAA